MNHEKEWHCLPADRVLQQLGSSLDAGLSDDEATARLAEYGPNELIEAPGRGCGRILWEQVSGAMVVLLIAAAAVSVFLGEFTDAVVILAIVVLNAALGFVQDYRAEKALAALKRLSVPTVRVRRGNTVHEISAKDLVPGDIVLLDVGNFVPADGRLLECVNLEVQEAALTGESSAVKKQTEPLPDSVASLGDRTNMAYMGTVVSYGHARAVVTATGMDTELGQIARSLQSVQTQPTPLQRRLAGLGHSLALVAVGIVVLIVVMGILQGEKVELILMTALSMAVAVVPEGLPAVATVALALGARRMFKRRALIRKLPAVETLGSVTVICTDKTGTLTENRMTVTTLDVLGQRIDVDPGGLDLSWSSFALLMAGSALCNDAELEIDPADPQVHAVGEPTESALLVTAAEQGLPKDQLVAIFPRVVEVPFDSDRKRMTTVHRLDSQGIENAGIERPILDAITAATGNQVAFTKGAVDSILDVCRYVWREDEKQTLDDRRRREIATANEELASHGMRVLGVAFRPLSTSEFSQLQQEPAAVEANLTYIGMLAMIDPPREEVQEAVERCRAAGIRPVMITGDHPLTAKHIAKHLGIATDGSVVTGQQLDRMSEAELHHSAASVATYARVTPKHKLQLVRALQKDGHFVAMTGDGVNDAPALKQAHIGIAMGITGTDVSKEASQMVLLDDNFATIVGAVEEGRIVYDNIRKFVRYTMTSNAGEVWVMVLGPLLGMPLPLLPLQILWINLVTDGLPGLALAVEKAERDTMKRPPHPPDERILGRGMGWQIAWIGLLMGIVSLVMGYLYWRSEPADETHWRTIIFTVLTLAQMGNAMAIRSSRDSLFQIGVFSNKLMIGSVGLTFILQAAVIYWPPLQQIFRTTALPASELAMCVVLSSVVFWAVEANKFWRRRRRSKRDPHSGREVEAPAEPHSQ